MCEWIRSSALQDSTTAPYTGRLTLVGGLSRTLYREEPLSSDRNLPERRPPRRLCASVTLLEAWPVELRWKAALMDTRVGHPNHDWHPGPAILEECFAEALPDWRGWKIEGMVQSKHTHCDFKLFGAGTRTTSLWAIDTRIVSEHRVP
jgi:hypothetical protein